MTFICDTKRHLVCLPYSTDLLHIMAVELGIGRHFFHRHHYDIPKRRIAEIMARCHVVNSRQIVLIIQGRRNRLPTGSTEVEDFFDRHLDRMYHKSFFEQRVAQAVELELERSIHRESIHKRSTLLR